MDAFMDPLSAKCEARCLRVVFRALGPIVLGIYFNVIITHIRNGCQVAELKDSSCPESMFVTGAMHC